MCGRFSQSMTREEYLSLLANEADRNIAYDPEPIGRYNVAPGVTSERTRRTAAARSGSLGLRARVVG